MAAQTQCLQLSSVQTRRACRAAAPKAFVAAPVTRKVAVRQLAASSPSRSVAVKAVAEAQAPAAKATGTKVGGRDAIWV